MTSEKKFLPIGEQNPAINRIKGIINNSKPNPEKLFVAEGIWIHKLILNSNLRIASFVVCEDFAKSDEIKHIIDEMSKRAEDLYTVSTKTFLKLSERDNPDGLLCLAGLPKFDANDFKPTAKSTILVIDGVEIPGNVGTMLRMADGAGVQAVFMPNRKVRLTHPKLIKGSQGAILTVPIYEFEDVDACYRLLKAKGFTVYLADTRATKTYYETKYAKRTAIVVGSERYGIARRWYDFDTEMVSIPMLGKCDSLNVGTAATVLVYDAAVKNI